MRPYVPTPAEKRVLIELARDGASNREIAERLGVVQQTVKFHINKLLWVTGCGNRTALVLWWIRVGQYAGVDSLEGVA